MSRDLSGDGSGSLSYSDSQSYTYSSASGSSYSYSITENMSGDRRKGRGGTHSSATSGRREEQQTPREATGKKKGELVSRCI